MIELINALTGVKMTVADDRVDEYVAAGHKLAADTTTSEKPKEAPKKRATTKKTSKK